MMRESVALTSRCQAEAAVLVSVQVLVRAVPQFNQFQRRACLSSLFGYRDHLPSMVNLGPVCGASKPLQ